MQKCMCGCTSEVQCSQVVEALTHLQQSDSGWFGQLKHADGVYCCHTMVLCRASISHDGAIT